MLEEQKVKRRAQMAGDNGYGEKKLRGRKEGKEAVP